MEHDAAVTHVTGRKRVVLKNNGGKIKIKIKIKIKMLDNLKRSMEEMIVGKWVCKNK